MLLLPWPENPLASQQDMQLARSVRCPGTPSYSQESI